MPRTAAGRWRGRTRAPATRARSPTTWAAATRSIRRSPRSRAPTPTRPNATTRPSSPRSRPEASSRRKWIALRPIRFGDAADVADEVVGGRQPVVDPARRRVALTGVPIDAAPSVALAARDQLADQRRADALPARTGRDKEVFEVARRPAPPRVRMQHVVAEADDMAIRADRNQRVHGLRRIEDARPRRPGDVLGDARLVERAVRRPQRAPRRFVCRVRVPNRRFAPHRLRLRRATTRMPRQAFPHHGAQ